MASQAPTPPTKLPVEQKWLEEQLNRETGANGKLDSVECKIIGEGQGFASIITKVKLNWSGNTKGPNENLPKSVIIKVPTTQRIEKYMGERFNEKFDNDFLSIAHGIEVDAYAYFNQHGPSPIPTARMYYSRKVEGDKNGMIIATDLSEVARSFTFNEDLSLEHLKVHVSHMADLQAYGFAHPTDLIKEQERNVFSDMFDNAAQETKKLRERYGDLIPFTDKELDDMEVLIKSYIGMFTDAKGHGYTPVLCLGDVQPNNMLWYKNEDNSIQLKVAAYIDFQIASFGICVNDFGLPMFMGLSAEVRRKHEIEILEHYLERLSSKCPNHPVTLKEAKELYSKLKLMLCFTMLAMVKDFDMKDMKEVSGMSAERLTESIKRYVAGIEDGLKEVKAMSK